MSIKIPACAEAEARLLGTALTSFDWLNAIMSQLTPLHFHERKNQKIFHAFKKLYDLDREVSFDTILALSKKEGIEVDHLVNISTVANRGLFVGDLIEEVKDAYTRRTVQAIASETVSKCADGSVKGDEIIRCVEEKLFSISQGNSESTIKTVQEMLDGPPTFLEIVQERQQKFQRGESAIEGYPCGYVDMEKYIPAFCPGHFTIIGARPGVGKTTIALNLIEKLAFEKNVPCLFFSLEMPQNEVITKLLAQTAEVELKPLFDGSLNGTDYQKVVSAAMAWDKKVFITDDQSALSIDQIKSRAIRNKRLHDIKVIIIDYVQLIKSPNAAKEARHLEIGDISRKLKEISKELNVSVIGLAQLNRDLEKRTEKKPFVSDLRESGSLEADADEILLLHRPDMFDVNMGKYDTVNLEVYVAKNRFGPCGMFTLTFTKSKGTLRNYAKYDHTKEDAYAPYGKSSPYDDF